MKSSSFNVDYEGGASGNAIAESPIHIAGCGCPMCAGHVERNVGDPTLDPAPSEDASVDRYAGTTGANGKPIWTAQQAAAYLNRTGANWITGSDPGRQSDFGTANYNPTEITFGFHRTQADLENNGYVYTLDGGANYYALTEYFQFGAFNAAQQAAARLSMVYWDDVAAVTFRESNIDDADITFGVLTNSPNTQAYSRLPFGTVSGNAVANEQIRDIVGDVWVSNAQPSNYQLALGGYGVNTLTHEIGHSLGLSHPGGYNFGPNFTATYANGAEYFQDARNYTIMSYWNQSDLGNGARSYDFNIMTTSYGATPMVHDILAIQNMYGADMTTRTGDTTYGFNSNAGRDVFDFTVFKAPVMTIWDAGGTDTLDASGYRVDQIIDLTPGSLSSIGGVSIADFDDGTLTLARINANRLAANITTLVPQATYDANVAALRANPVVGRMIDNVGIAYGAIIENAVGGSANDRITGNAVANVLTGGAGNDSLFGAEGDDRLLGGLGADALDGGAGTDTASYANATAAVALSLLSNTGTAGEAIGDTWVSIEVVEGSGFNDTITGGNNADRLVGLAGNDVLDGGAGADTIEGGLGDDRLLGGTGSDQLFGGDGADYLDGGSDADSLYGGIGADTLIGGGGNDVLDGGDGADSLDGGSEGDMLTGGAGDDYLFGNTGRDTLYGGDGADRLDGGTDDDLLYGEAGADNLVGGNGRDTLFGGADADRLDGGNDDDRLNGGAGADTLTGGGGKDVFVIADLGSTDTITDFRRGEDKIDFTGLDANSNVAGNQGFTWIGSSAFTGTAGELHTYTEGRNIFISGDVNGDGVADFVVALGTNPFTVNDLILTVLP